MEGQREECAHRTEGKTEIKLKSHTQKGEVEQNLGLWQGLSDGFF